MANDANPCESYREAIAALDARIEILAEARFLIVIALEQCEMSSST